MYKKNVKTSFKKKKNQWLQDMNENVQRLLVLLSLECGSLVSKIDVNLKLVSGWNGCKGGDFMIWILGELIGESMGE